MLTRSIKEARRANISDMDKHRVWPNWHAIQSRIPDPFDHAYSLWRDLNGSVGIEAKQTRSMLMGFRMNFVMGLFLYFSLIIHSKANYNMWRKQMEFYLMSNVLWEIMCEEEIKPPEEASMQKQWTMKGAWALFAIKVSWMMTCLSIWWMLRLQR